jgi:hypothetical protein
MLSSFTTCSCGSGSAATGSATTAGACRVRGTTTNCGACRVGAAVVLSAAAAAAAAPRVVRRAVRSFAGVLSSAATAYTHRHPCQPHQRRRGAASATLLDRGRITSTPRRRWQLRGSDDARESIKQLITNWMQRDGSPFGLVSAHGARHSTARVDSSRFCVDRGHAQGSNDGAFGRGCARLPVNVC